MTTPPLNLRPTTPPPGSPSASDFSYERSTHLYLFTSLTAGSSHIITATSRLETILKANRVAFKAVDCATDEKARRLWSRRAGKRKLPGLVREGMVVADLEEVEEWNEFGEIKQNLGDGSSGSAAAPQAQTQNQSLPVAPAAPPAASGKENAPTGETTPAPPPGPARTEQQQQQSLLAREAAARGAQRGKAQSIPIAAAEVKPAAASTSPPTSVPPTSPSGVTSISPPLVATTKSAPDDHLATSPKLPSPHSDTPEVADDYDINAPTSKHSTSSSTALPPLAIPTGGSAPSSPPRGAAPIADAAGRGRAETASSLKSPAQPDAPPPTAVEGSGAGGAESIDAALALRPAAGAGATAADRSKSVPADAELNQNDNEDAHDNEGEDEQPGTPHSPPPPAEEEKDEDDEDGPVERTPTRDGQVAETDRDGPPSPRIAQGDPQRHIKFQEDQIKGDAKAGEKAEESVGD